MQGAAHPAGQHGHTIERLHDMRRATAVGVEHGRDRVPTHARFTRVYEGDACFERGVCGGRQRNLFHRHAVARRAVAERQPQRATKGGGVVILTAAGDAQLFDFERATPLGEPRGIRLLSLGGGDGGRERDAGRR